MAKLIGKNWFVILGVVTTTAPLGCSKAEDSDLPAGWEDAKEISVSTSECLSEIEPIEESVLLTATASDVNAKYLGAGFRCSQEVCAYHQEKDGAARVLVQPCDIDPEIVAACDCRYDLEFSFPRPSGDEVEIWKGSDAWGSDPEQHIVHEEELEPSE